MHLFKDPLPLFFYYSLLVWRSCRDLIKLQIFQLHVLLKYFSLTITLVQRTKDVACPIKITLSVSHCWNGNEMHIYAQRKSERDDYKATMVPN